MVLRKMLDKFISRSESKSNSYENGDTKKKLKKVRSIRKASKKTGPEEEPNYMKSTRSYEARKEKSKVTNDSSTTRVLLKNSSLKLFISSITKNRSKNLHKDSQTPESVDLNENHEALALNNCDYTYCSLHGHKHGALKRFLSGRRRPSLKLQKSVKLLGFSSIKKKGDREEIELVEDVVNELFIEIHTKLQELGEERSQLQDSVTSFEDCGDRNSELSLEDIQVINQFLEFIEKGYNEETQLTHEVCIQPQNGGEVENNRPKVKYGKFKRQQTKSRESVKKLNPRPPRLLDLPVEQEQEKVNLKHQTVNERKDAEEWMVDYALRKALRRLGSTRKSKVPLLVAAFETATNV